MPKTFGGILNQNRIFLIVYLLFLALAFVLQLLIPKSELFLLVNRHYSDSSDIFFKLITYFGDGLTMILVGIGLLLVKYRYSLFTLLAYIYTSVIAQVLKKIFHAPRPTKFFEGIEQIRTIKGYPVYAWNSFPSGHSVSAFALAAVLAYLLPQKQRHWLLVLLALITAFSRVYLAQHFFQDIVAGSVIGVFFTLQLAWWLENSRWYHSPKLNGRLFAKN